MSGAATELLGYLFGGVCFIVATMFLAFWLTERQERHNLSLALFHLLFGLTPVIGGQVDFSIREPAGLVAVLLGSAAVALLIEGVWKLQGRSFPLRWVLGITAGIFILDVGGSWLLDEAAPGVITSVTAAAFAVVAVRLIASSNLLEQLAGMAFFGRALFLFIFPVLHDRGLHGIGYGVGAVLALSIGLLLLFASFTRLRTRLRGTMEELMIAYNQLGQVTADLEFRNQEYREACARAESANAAKTTFLGNMSHELRTPLNAVIGFADLLEAQPDAVSARGREYVRHIRNAGGLLLDMVDQTLRLANFDAGSGAQLIRAHDLCRIVPDAIERRSDRVRNRNVALHPPADGEIMVDCDEAFARQALVHVLDDALRRTPQDSAIAIRYLSDATQAGVAVDEPGASFTESAASRAFDPFWRPGSHLTRSSEGAGLGLPLAKLLVEAAGGAIALMPGEGGGIRVTLTFPRSAIGASAPALAAAG